MLIGWIFFIVGLFLNALVLVVLVNRDQLTHLGAQLKRPDESELKIGEPVVQRLDEEVAEPAVIWMQNLCWRIFLTLQRLLRT